MTRVARNREDAEGKVRIVIHLVGVRHRPIRGNMMKVLTVPHTKVSDIAALVHRALFRVVGGIQKEGGGSVAL